MFVRHTGGITAWDVGASSQMGWKGAVGSDAAWGGCLLIPRAPRDGVSLISLENQAKEKEAAVSEGRKGDLMTGDIIFNKNIQDPKY